MRATAKPKCVPMAYPHRPTTMPGPITELFFNALPMTGTNGGLHISATDVVRVVSASTRSNALNIMFISIENVIINMVMMKSEASRLENMSVLTCNAIVKLNISMKYVPASKVRCTFLTLFNNDANTEMTDITKMKTDWNMLFGNRYAMLAPMVMTITDSINALHKCGTLLRVNSPKNSSLSLFPTAMFDDMFVLFGVLINLGSIHLRICLPIVMMNSRYNALAAMS